MPVDFYVKVSVCPCPRCVWLLVFIGPLYDHKTNIPPSLQMIIAIITSVASQTRLLVTTVLSQSEASISVTWPPLTNQRPGSSPWNCHLQLSRVRGELQRVGRWLIVVSVKTGIRDNVTNNFPPERVIEKVKRWVIVWQLAETGICVTKGNLQTSSITKAVIYRNRKSPNKLFLIS